MKQILSQICISLGCKKDRHITNKETYKEHQLLGHQIMHKDRFIQELQIFMENRQNTFINYSANKLQETLNDYKQRFNQNIQEFIDDVFELIKRDIIDNSKEEFDLISISDVVENQESLNDLVEMFNGNQTQPLIKKNQFSFQISQIEIKLHRLENQLQSTLLEHLNMILHLQQSQPKQLSNKNNKQDQSNSGNAPNIKQPKKSTLIQRSNIQRNIESNKQNQLQEEIVCNSEAKNSIIQLNDNQSEQDNEQNIGLSTQNGKDSSALIENIFCKSEIIDKFEKQTLNLNQMQLQNTFNEHIENSSKGISLLEVSQSQQANYLKNIDQQSKNQDLQLMPLKGYKQHDYSGQFSGMQKQRFELEIKSDKISVQGDILHQQQSQQQQSHQQQQQQQQQQQKETNRTAKLPLKGYKTHNYHQSCQDFQNYQKINYQNQNNIGQKKLDQKVLKNTKVFVANIQNFEKTSYIMKEQKQKQQCVEINEDQNNQTQTDENQIFGKSFQVQISDCSVQYKNKFRTATFEDLSFTTVNALFSLDQNAMVSFNIVGSSQRYSLKLGIIDKNQFTRESLLGSMKGVYCVDKDGSLFIEKEKSLQIRDHSIIPNLKVDIKYTSQTRALMFSYHNQQQCIQMKQSTSVGQFQFFIYSENLTITIV